MEVGRTRRLMRLKRLGRMPLISPRLWWRRGVFWIGAILVAAVAVFFARASDWAGQWFIHVIAGRGWLPFVLAPLGLTISFLLTQFVFPGAQGSGIPQTIAALHMHDQDMVDRVLSLRIAVGKVVLTLLGQIGIVDAAFLRAKRRYAIVLVVVASAVLTPPDAFSMLALVVPAYALYEGAIITVHWMAKKKAQAEARS